MKRRSLLPVLGVFGILVLSFPSSQSARAQAGVENTRREGVETIPAVPLRADVTFLASPPLEGRRALERGSEVAIQYLLAEFAKIGLKPAGGASFVQEVPLVDYAPDPKETRLTVRRGGAEHSYGFATDVVVFFPQN